MYGVYYYPANRHYNQNVDVGCDRCGDIPISACLGWEDDDDEYDLCLKCATEVENYLDGR